MLINKNNKKRSLRRLYMLAAVGILLAIFTLTHPQTQYEKVVVHEGDTLESIILENTSIPWGGHIKNLIIKTKEVNTVDLDTLYPGQKIVIAVYKK